jgi:alpha-tubulin suppressor-like RCC1 family protein
VVFAMLAGVLSPAPAAAREAIAISAGSAHTCGLTRTGGIRCWGSNNEGQLGIGATGDRHTPTTVVGLTHVKAVSAGGQHTCAITHAGGVMCWGNNDSGQLGNGSTSSSGVFVPVAVVGLDSGVVAIAAGYAHTCALTDTSAIKCWGGNASGQLGINSTDNALTPVDVHGLSSGVAAISAGQSHTCAVISGTRVACWGWNGSGQLGDGTKGNQRLVPVLAKGISAATDVAAGGDHTCALISGGGVVKCWGENVTGELGDGNTTEQTRAVRVHRLTEAVVAISAGGGHTCVTAQSNEVKCWGNNVYGQIGNGTSTNAVTAVRVLGVRSASASTAGGNHSCALITTGRIKCWGQNEFGELGDGTANNKSIPVNVVGF